MLRGVDPPSVCLLASAADIFLSSLHVILGLGFPTSRMHYIVFSFFLYSMHSTDPAFAWSHHHPLVHLSLPPSSETQKRRPNQRRNRDHTHSRGPRRVDETRLEVASTFPKHVFLAAVAASVASTGIDLHLSSCV
mmetsp:Transcript_9232/g.56107  ORF Transcript_9232/g.56107 Transcript_9232/m.56107 type:complete len:135 (-) Transcript_9232:1202-1606(-)